MVSTEEVAVGCSGAGWTRFGKSRRGGGYELELGIEVWREMSVVL